MVQMHQVQFRIGAIVGNVCPQGRQVRGYGLGVSVRLFADFDYYVRPESVHLEVWSRTELVGAHKYGAFFSCCYVLKQAMVAVQFLAQNHDQEAWFRY